MTARNEDLQRDSFNNLVVEGVYQADFEHPPHAREFVSTILNGHVFPFLGQGPHSLLDCGCGTGAWLAFLCERCREAGIRARPIGFDISDGMVDLARKTMDGRADPNDLHRGDVLDPTSYVYDKLESGIDLIFAYDVIQQLPRSQQFAACRLIAEKLAPGGVAVIFDHDRNSPYGRKMGRKKFLTRYFGLPLVPRYYCNAKYPPLAQFAERLAENTGLNTDVIPDANGKKRALLIVRDGRS